MARHHDNHHCGKSELSRPPTLPGAPPPRPAVWCVWHWQLLSKEGISLSPGDERHLVSIAPPFSPSTPLPAPRPQKVPPVPAHSLGLNFLSEWLFPEHSCLYLELFESPEVPLSSGVQTGATHFRHPGCFFQLWSRGPGASPAPLRPNSTTFRSRELITGSGPAARMLSASRLGVESVCGNKG